MIGAWIAAGAAIGLVAWIGSLARRQRRALRRRIRFLEQSAQDHDSAATIAPGDAPDPVCRYLEWSAAGYEAIRLVRIRQVGRLRTRPGAKWLNFVAEHVAAPGAQAFVWNARVRVAPFVHVGVVDSLTRGRGCGEVNLMSAIRLDAMAGGPQMNSGTLHRYLAEAVWYPTALRPSARLS